MDNPILHYDGKSRQFWFPFDKLKMPYPCVLGKAGSKRIAVFSGRYPMSLIGAKVFKNIYPEGQATKDALLKIRDAKEAEKSLSEKLTVAKFENDFRIPPYEHQRDAIEHILQYERLALLLEQGLGKTYISLMGFSCLKKLGLAKRALVICPGIVFHNWIAETAKYTDLSLLPYKGDPATRSAQRETFANSDWDIALTTFDMLIDRTRTPKAMFAELWEEVASEKRIKLCAWWEKEGKITSDQMKILLDSKGSGENQAKILQSIPKNMLPLNSYLGKLKEYSNRNFLQGLEYDVLIVDEASRCLDHTTRRSQAVEALAARAGRCYLLSGTLCVGRPTDMYTPMTILSPDILNMGWQRFSDTYCERSAGNKHVITGYKNLSNLKLRIDPHIISKTRDECIDLPKRIIVERSCDPTPEMRALYNSIAMNDEIEIDGTELNVETILVKIAKCMQVVNGFIYYSHSGELCNDCPKVLDCVENGITQGSGSCLHPSAEKPGRKTHLLKTNPKIEMLREDLADGGDEKTIIWAWHQEDLKAIAALLRSEKIPFIIAHEKDSASRYENDPSVRVFLGQTTQGIGITLNSATCTIYFSHGTALEPRLQSMDRNYRIGQQRPVIVKDYIVNGTIEESLVALLAHKTDVRDFMQRRVSCLACKSFENCEAEHLGPGCIHHGQKLSAETIKKLKIPLLQG